MTNLEMWETEEADLNRKKDDLVWALRSRVLTAEEMQEVRDFGYRLYLRFSRGSSGSYSRKELEQRLSADLLNQFYMRLASESSPRAESSPSEAKSGK